MTDAERLVARIVESVSGDESWMRRATLSDDAINALMDSVFTTVSNCLEQTPLERREALADQLLDEARLVVATLAAGDDATPLIGSAIVPTPASLADIVRVITAATPQSEA